MMIFRAALSALFVCLFSLALARAQTGDVVGVHDPAVIRDGDAWYLYYTQPGIGIRKSTDLKTWNDAGKVFEDTPAWAKQAVPRSRDIWAPDISFFNGRFHLYYAVSSFGAQRSVIGLATNKTLDTNSPDYKWIDEGLVIDSRPVRDDFNAIDAQLALDEHGQPWLAFGSFWNGLKICKIDAATGKRPPDDDKLFSLASRNGGAIEAPFIYRKGKNFYLFVSFDQCCQGSASTYKTMVGRAEKITGPYFARDGKPMVQGAATLLLSGHGHVRGPGHCAVIKDHDTDYLVHHFYDADHNGRRSFQIRPLIWADDGWPLAGEPALENPTSNKKPVARSDIAGAWRHSVDYGEDRTISLTSDGKITVPAGAGEWSLRNDKLILRWPRADAPGGAWIDECYPSNTPNTFIGRNQAGAVIRLHRDE